MKSRIVKHSLLAALALAVGMLMLSVMSAYSQEEPKAPDVLKGAEVFQNNCAACHGKQGEGNMGIPNLAGAAGHVQQLGIPPEAAGPGIIQMLRGGIPGNMPAFPPDVLSDADIMNLGAYLFTLEPTTGANLYRANCSLCHGANAEGKIGPQLAGVAEKLPQIGLTKEQLAAGFPDLVRKGIPGKMPANPALTDVEISRLFDYLWDLPSLDSWEAKFQAEHGRAPTAQDKADREWSLAFLAANGREPSDADWIRRWQENKK
ncbi:MAG: c-type cytochrome [Chloroflexi bacterium]|nr:c-type cytochrome [Chloroflexota bacterium]